MLVGCLFSFNLRGIESMAIDYGNDLTNTIYQLESSAGKNKKAYTPNQYGALGGFQITPGAYEMVQRFNPEWKGQSFSTVAKDDNLARKAATDYLMVLSRELERLNIPLTNTNLLAAYHSGPGNVNSLGPYGQDYVSKARALAGVQPGETW